MDLEKRNFLLKKIGRYAIIGSTLVGVSALLAGLSVYREEKEQKEKQELIEKNAIIEIRIEHLNSDGIEDIVLVSNDGKAISFYGVTIDDSVVYRTLNQIKENYKAEKERMLHEYDIKTKEKLEQFLTP